MNFVPKQRPLIIGQAPARGNDGKPPFFGQSGTRLALLAGVGNTGDVLPKYFELENLICRYPGKDGRGKGDKFDRAAAKLQAHVLMDAMEVMPPRWVILMGKSVARAFGQYRRGYLQPWPWNEHRWVIFPHPSGVNRWYNNPDNWAMASVFLKEVLHAHRW